MSWFMQVVACKKHHILFATSCINSVSVKRSSPHYFSALTKPKITVDCCNPFVCVHRVRAWSELSGHLLRPTTVSHSLCSWSYSKLYCQSLTWSGINPALLCAVRMDLQPPRPHSCGFCKVPLGNGVRIVKQVTPPQTAAVCSPRCPKCWGSISVFQEGQSRPGVALLFCSSSCSAQYSANPQNSTANKVRLRVSPKLMLCTGYLFLFLLF